QIMADLLPNMLHIRRHWHEHFLQVMIESHAGMRNCLLFAILFEVAASVASGQRVSGELRLQVMDATGAGLHASGTIIGRPAGIDRTFETDEGGHLIVRALPLGRYELSIRSEGFTTRTISIDIRSQLPLEQQIRLEVTPLSTTIEVKDESLIDPVQT